MIIEIKAPSPGESISELEVASWFVSDGDFVSKDQEIAELESEKATLPLVADESGEIRILKKTGESVPVGEILCTIDTSKAGNAKPADESSGKNKEEKSSEEPSDKGKEDNEEKKLSDNKGQKTESNSTEDNSSEIEKPAEEPVSTAMNLENVKVTPVAKKIMEELNISLEDVINGIRKIGSDDIKYLSKSVSRPDFTSSTSREESRVRMSMLRRKLSERLVAVKNETAMLTTFNEADMGRIIAIRKNYQEPFVKEHGIKLGFMSFFVKACTVALKLFPVVNSRIEGEEVITPEYCDIGIAVQADKGLMVPVLRNTEAMSLARVEKEIAELAVKARANRISIEEMSGGTFTITNGGVFGSMMSTPILNPPQAAILGMHNIIERPVAREGEVVIRPMMYLALSYDHRVIDGKDSVSFLVKVKELLENPEKMLFGGNDPEKALLEIP